MQMRQAAIGITLLLLGISFLGSLHGLGDSLAVFRMGFCALLITLAIIVKTPGRVRLSLVLIGLAGVGSVLWYKVSLQQPGPVTIYQKNMFHVNGALPDLAADILSTDADFVSLQEVSKKNETLLVLLAERYPHQFLCRYSPDGVVVILSGIEPTEPGICGQDHALARITVALETGPLHVASAHLTWPFPGQQNAQLRSMVADLATLEHGVLIGGDFNMVPWSSALKRFARATETRRAGPARATFLLGSLPLSIDHVFAPGGGVTERRPLFGSDHFGLLARVHPRGDEDNQN